jgi:O-glycosyl hydrolase
MRASIPFVLAGHAALSAAMPSDKAVLKARAGATSTTSSYDGNTKLQANAAPVQGAGNANGESPWSLSIDDTSSGYKQKITGFGAAVTDSTVTTFNTLSSDTLSQLLNDLMTPSGANFAFMRHTIGASDLSGNPVYTYDDNGGNADPNLSGFGLGDRGTAMAALLAQMKKLQSSLTIFGSPWSPPGWMKLNNEIEGGTDNNNLNDGYLNGNMGADASAFAQYFVKYIQAYNSAGANIDGITIQNEPLNSNGGYPTMYMFAEEQAELIQSYVGPALSSAGLDTKIWAYDHNTGKPEILAIICLDHQNASLI